MQLYVADYLGDTRHLTTEQHGAYLLLLMAMWRANGSLTSDPAKLSRIAGLTATRWERICDDVLAFFADDGGRLTHGRITSELQKAQRTSEARSEAGSRGAMAKSQKTKETSEAIAVDLPKPGQSPAEAYQISDIRKGEEAIASLSPSGDAAVKYPDVFEACWKAYPHVKGRSSKTKACGYWRRLPAETRTALLGAIERYAAKGREPNSECGAPAMERWLRDSRFLDWLASDQTAAVMAHTFPGPAEIRAAVVSAMGEDFAKSWLDRCEWDAEARAVISGNGFVVDRLRQEVGAQLSALDVRIRRKAA